MQLYQSPGISDMSQLIVFVKCFFNNEIHKDLLFCELLKQRCTREDIFSTVNDFFNKKTVSWKKCACVTTDGEASWTGIKKKVHGLSSVQPMKFIHYIIRRQAFAGKRLDLALGGPA